MDRSEIERMYRDVVPFIILTFKRNKMYRECMQDAIQQVFLKLLYKMRELKFPDERKRYNWLYTCIKNECETMYEKNKKLVHLGNANETFIMEKYENGRFSFKELLKRVKEIRIREIAMLKYQWKYTDKEIAYRVKCSLSTVRSEIKKFLKIVQHMLNYYS
ncbi:MAG: sigma-70 family RNA polymerase sigma factor [Chitinivibrionales bacterium]|nr:sigma-70 family RNA polymerase sigma factor [Chitinivibrionales bacterium]